MLLFTSFEMHTMTLTEFLSAKICYFLVNSFMWNLILWDDYWATSSWTIDILWLVFHPDVNLSSGNFLASHLDSMKIGGLELLDFTRNDFHQGNNTRSWARALWYVFYWKLTENYSVHFPFGAASANIIMGLGMFELSQVEFSAC